MTEISHSAGILGKQKVNKGHFVNFAKTARRVKAVAKPVAAEKAKPTLGRYFEPLPARKPTC